MPALPMRIARTAVRGRRAAWMLSALLLGSMLHEAAAQTASMPARSPAKVSTPSEEGVRWGSLTPAQREVLAPLQAEWPRVESPRKQKWLVLADRFKTLSPDERARVTERMSEWAKLTPAERTQARFSFQQARDVPLHDRKERWQAYQSLDPDAKRKYAARAASSASATTPRGDVVRREAAAKAAAGSSPASGKINVVPNPALSQPAKSVAPTLVQAAPGATTTLLTRRPMPPAHQQTGMPKIATTPEFVNRSTLLPRRGPQAAGIASAPSIRPSLAPMRKPTSAPATLAAAAPASAPPLSKSP